MDWHSRLNKHLPIMAVPLLMLLANASLQADPVSVMSSVSPEGMNYLYDFAITNNSSTNPLDELVSVDFSLPTGAVIGNATAPPGNGATTDPSGDFVEFTSDNLSGFTAGMTVDGFQFVSPLQFTSFPFTANYLDSTETTLTTFSGTTNVVPEPGTLSLLAGASVLLLGRFRYLRKRAARQ